MPVAEKPRGGKFVDKLGRYNQITQAHARKQHLAEAAGEPHRTASAIQSLKRRNWTARETICAVVVILEDHCSDLPGQAEDLEPAIDAHRDSKWKLVGRRNVYEFGQAVETLTRLKVESTHVDPVHVDRYRDDLSAR